MKRDEGKEMMKMTMVQEVKKGETFASENESEFYLENSIVCSNRFFTSKTAQIVHKLLLDMI